MPSLGTGFGSRVPHACLRTASGDLIAPSFRLETPAIPPEKAAEVALALCEGFFATDAPAAVPVPDREESEVWLGQEAAARHLDMSHSWMRKNWWRIPRNDITKKYHIDDLNDRSRWRKSRPAKKKQSDATRSAAKPDQSRKQRKSRAKKRKKPR